MPRRSLPTPGTLRRERRALDRLREEKLRDLGGLMLEMYRRDRFREDLLRQRCDELLAIDARLGEVDALLLLAQGRSPLDRCECGAPLVFASRFCANCGRPVGEAAVIVCGACGHALAADAQFCPGCGLPASTGADRDGPGAEAQEA